MILDSLLALEELLLLLIPVLDLVLHLLAKAIECHLLLHFQFLLLSFKLLGRPQLQPREVFLEVLLYFDVLFLVGVVGCDQNLDVAVDLVVLLVELRVPLDQRAYVFGAQLSLARGALSAFPGPLNTLPLLTELFVLASHIVEFILVIQDFELQGLAFFAEGLDLLITLLLLL